VNDENILTWSATNMVTIWLMAAIGALIFMLAAKAVKNSKGGASVAVPGPYQSTGTY